LGKQDIAILLDNNRHVAFLEKFFRERLTYRPGYFNSAELFVDHVKKNPPAAIIVSVASIKSVAEIVRQHPAIALIRTDTEKNIKTAMEQQVKCYIYAPYLGLDLAHKLEAVIHEKNMLVKMESRRKELEAIIELTQLLSGTLDSKELLFRIVKKISEILPVTRCSIIKMDWKNKTAYVVASFEDPTFTGVKLSLKKYPEIREALTLKKHIFVRDVAKDPIMAEVRDIISPLHIRSILVVPIFYRSEVIGTLFLRTSRAKHTFTRSEISLMNKMAHASANSLNNAFLFEQVEDEKSRLEKLSITDYLTGIYNPRYFHHRIAEEFSRAQRYSSSLNCLMLDIDNFKKINDVYGHKTGDIVLKEFAARLKKHSRKSDLLARYGGDEFILLLPEITPEGAIAEAERIRECVYRERLKSLKHKQDITISIGIATYPHPAIKTHDDLISSADKALLRAKDSGRNKVVIYGT
jgi:diguanylate cyclase (GGDEF)-like protein